ncbi:MAG TPA: hypothetical protein VHE35_29130 [Kofleriaceae bacterium]|nr:hypothetical protein [Kofleriaceae bacterium]
MTSRSFATVSSLLIMVSATLAARAQPGPGPAKIVPPPPPAGLVGLTQVGSLVPDRGFVDDPVATDGTNLAVIVTDGAALAEARVLGPDGVSHSTVDLAPIIPTVRRMYLLGSRLFVVADDPAGGPVTAALVGLDGKVVHRHARATDLALRSIGGKDTVVAYTHTSTGAGEQHQIALFDPVSGKKIAKRGGKIVIGSDGRDSKLDLRVDYWLDDHTVAVGMHGGVWRKSEDQRSPDTLAQYDLVQNKWLKDEPVPDLLAQARRLETLTAHPGERVFVNVPSDGSDLEIWRDGVPTPVTLDPPQSTYDPASARIAMRGDRVWLSMMVDPTNPAAVARKKADPEYLDLFEIDGTRAVRRARIFAPKKKLTWGWAGDTLWVLEKNVGFGRGGKALRLYHLDT